MDQEWVPHPADRFAALCQIRERRGNVTVTCRNCSNMPQHGASASEKRPFAFCLRLENTVAAIVATIGRRRQAVGKSVLATFRPGKSRANVLLAVAPP